MTEQDPPDRLPVPVPPLAFDPEQTMLMPIVDADGNPRFRNWANSLVTAEMALDKKALRAASAPGSLPTPDDPPTAVLHLPDALRNRTDGRPAGTPPGAPQRPVGPTHHQGYRPGQVPPTRPSAPPRRPVPPGGDRPAPVHPTAPRPPMPPGTGARPTAPPGGRPSVPPGAVPATPGISRPRPVDPRALRRPLPPRRSDPARRGTPPPEEPTVTLRVGSSADAPAMKTDRTSGVLRAGLVMAVAAVASRLTGFLAKLAFLAVFGAAMINSSYTMANTLPNIVFELLIGGVLSSVAIPLLARAQRSDPDGGTAYTQRLVTLGFVGLLLATVLAVAAAPLITKLYLSDGSQVDPQLTTDLAYLLLPQILFYGLAALFGAILNTKERFAAQAWAPVLNNLVLIGVSVGFVLIWRNEPDTLSRAQILFLGIGTTAGIALQAVVMLPSLRRSGFRFRWRWGWDKRMAEAGALAGWAVLYVIVSQVGYIATTRTLSSDESGIAIFSYASLLFQMPYGILGVSILTAIMPRMSRHAAAGQMEHVKEDMSLAARLSAMALLPVTAGILALAGAVGVAASAYGRNSVETGVIIGVVLSALAIGLLPLAMSLVQMRVFYAMKDGRTPVLINLIMVAVRVALIALAAAVFRGSDHEAAWLIAAMALATAISYVVGAVVGEIWLRARLGPMGTRRVLTTITKMGIASAIGGFAAWATVQVAWGGVPDSLGQALVQCATAGVVGLAIILSGALLLGVEELDPLVHKLGRRLPGGSRTAGSRPVPGTVGAPPPDQKAGSGDVERLRRRHRTR